MEKGIIEFPKKLQLNNKKITRPQARLLILKYLKNEIDLFIYQIELGVYIPILKKECDFDDDDEAYYAQQITMAHLKTLIQNASMDLYDRYKGECENVEAFLLNGTDLGAIAQLVLHGDLFKFDGVIHDFEFKSEGGLTFCRLPFDPAAEVVETPTWDILLSNFSNTDALKAWVGSLFMRDSDRSQYLWLYGSGGNGKSTMARVLGEVLERFVVFVNAPEGESARKHFSSQLKHKRLAVFDDFKFCSRADNFLRSGLFKSITGGTKVQIERKYENPFDTKINCKFLFTSNVKPSLSGDMADQRRIIYCEAQDLMQARAHDPSFYKKLKREVYDFISNCILKYHEFCPQGGPIPVDADIGKGLADEAYDNEQAFFDTSFVFDSEQCVVSSSLQIAFVDSPFKTIITLRGFKEFLRHNGCKSSTRYIDGKKTRVWIGLRCKNNAEKQCDGLARY